MISKLRGPRRCTTLIFVSVCYLPSAPSRAGADGCLPWSEVEAASVSPEGVDPRLRFGAIVVHAGDLFDPTIEKQNKAVHRAGDALHLKTCDSTIVAALPFRPGEPFSLELVAEAERTLRSKRYIREASVLLVRRCGDAVDVEVRTVDNWTLTPSIGFGSAGGVNRFTIELQDRNLLGFGKELKFRLKKAGDERESVFPYADDNLFGSRHRLRLELGSTEDGRRHGVEFGLPFVSTLSPAAWWVSASTVRESDDRERFFEAPTTLPPADGEAQPLVESDRLDLQAQRRVETSSFDLARIGLGLHFERQVTSFDDGTATPALAGDFNETYPYLLAQWGRSRWMRQENFLGLGRIEDIDLGATTELEAGVLLRAFDNARDGLRLRLSGRRGWQFSEESLHHLSFDLLRYVDGAAAPKSSGVPPVPALSLARPPQQPRSAVHRGTGAGLLAGARFPPRRILRPEGLPERTPARGRTSGRRRRVPPPHALESLGTRAHRVHKLCRGRACPPLGSRRRRARRDGRGRPCGHRLRYRDRRDQKLSR